MNSPEIKPKRFLAIPRDAYDILARKYATYEEAAEAASTEVEEGGCAMFIVETKAIVARADRPVKVRKL